MIVKYSLAAFVLFQIGVNQSSPAQDPPVPVIRGEIPQHILFYQFFRQITPEAGGPDGQSRFEWARLAQVKQAAQLQDYQVQIIQNIASNCIKKVSIVDEMAGGIIEFGRDHHLNPGGPPSQLTPDLKALDENRTKIIQESIFQLREALGKEVFTRFDSALMPASRSAMSVRLPDELSRLAPTDRQIQRGDFQFPEHESLYESKLPVRMMITAVGADGITEKTRYKMDEPVFFKVTLLNSLKGRTGIPELIIQTPNCAERAKCARSWKFNRKNL